MTAMQKFITELENRLTTSGMTVYLIDRDNKNSTNQLFNRLTTDGFNVVKITSLNDTFNDRGVLIINERELKRFYRNPAFIDKLRTATNVRFMLFPNNVLDPTDVIDFLPDWERVKHVKLDDIHPDGKHKERIHLDIWKRKRVEV